MRSRMKYAYIIERAPDGSYSAYVPDLPGCTTAGDTVEEVHQNMKEAVSLYIESLKEHGEPVPPPTSQVGTVEAA
jgi:predicted RNase H-like HicB family nuclease